MNDFFLACTILFVAYCFAITIFDSQYSKQNPRQHGGLFHDFYSAQHELGLKIEERELRFERFAAWTECPHCLYFDLHPIKDSLPKSCRRQCDKCKYVWRQK